MFTLSWLRVPDSAPAIAPLKFSQDTTPAQFVVTTILAPRRYSVIAASLMVIHQLGEAMVPIIMGLAIDRAVATGNSGELVLWLAILAADFALLSASYRFGSRIGELGLERVQHRLRTQVADRILDARGIGGTRRLPGELLSISTSDVAQLARAVSIGQYPVGELAAVIFAGIVLVTISWPLGAIILVGAPLMLLLMDRAGRPLRRRSRHEQERAGAAAGNATDLVSGIRVLHGIHAESAAADRYRHTSQSALSSSLRAKSSEGLYVGSMALVSGLFVGAVAVIAGIFAASGTITIGQLITVVGIAQFVLSPLQSFAFNFGAIWASAAGSAERVLAVLNAPAAKQPRDADATVTSTSGRTVTEAGTTVSTRAPSGASIAVQFVQVNAGPLQDFTLDVSAGEIVGLVMDAAEAAALVSVVAGHRESMSGQVLLGSVPVHSIQPESLPSAITVAPHTVEIFDDSLRENVACGRGPDSVLDDATAHRLLHLAGAGDVVESLPHGIHSQLGESGLRLSGGQRQRVALARAFASVAPILVLHDPTTSVDSVTEAIIANRFVEANRARSCLVITSSPAVLAACSRVVLVRDGRIVADSTHHELMVTAAPVSNFYRERLA